jgi:hypothetical protein
MELILAILIVLGFAVDVVFYILATGKFARIDARARLLKGDSKTVEGGLSKLTERFNTIEADQKNLRAMVESWDIEGVFRNLDEITSKQNLLRQDVNLLLRAGDEHPVTAPLETSTKSRGGRPKKVESR